MWFQYRPYVPVAQRRAKAAREVAKRTKKGTTVSPVVITGLKIAQSFWGKAWCQNLEAYSDYSNRLPRGRTYVRNGSVVDLQITSGKITALVSGSQLYDVVIKITELPSVAWKQIKSRCSGQIGSLVELLQGKLSKGVMDIVTEKEGGLFPKPREIKLSCSCPDGASMCKHVAAVMYGIGARLDHEPELLFKLRHVDHLELIEGVIPATASNTATGKTLEQADVADVFGIEMTPPEVTEPEVVGKRTSRVDPGSTKRAGTKVIKDKSTRIAKLTLAVKTKAKKKVKEGAILS